VLRGVVKSLPNLVGIVSFNESTGGTNHGTLTARNARSFGERKVEGLSNAGINTSVVSADNRYVLLIAGCDTSTAKDTLVVISYEMRGRIVKLVGGLIAAERLRVYAVLKAKLLKLAVGGTGAGKTVLIVSGKNKLKSGLSCLSNLFGIGFDFHTFGYGIYASGNETSCTGSLNDADSARADFIFFFHKAESGDFHACLAGSLKNSCALRNAYGNSVNSYI
jgi:hypothetical protein